MKSISLLQPFIAKFKKERNETPSIYNKQFVCFVFPYTLTTGSGSGSIDYVEMANYDDEGDSSLNMPLLYILYSKDSYDTDKLLTFVRNVLASSSLWNIGVEGFRPGSEYFVNDTLAKKLRLNAINIKNAYVLPDLLTDLEDIVEDWELSKVNEFESVLKSVAGENDILNFQYEEDELKDFYATFVTQILTETQIDAETRLLGNNPIYDIVLKYYQGHKSDEASKNIGMLLKSVITANSTTSGCGCNSKTSTSIDTTSCTDMYATAMQTWLIEMLGNVAFYNDWFNQTINSTFVANDRLCTLLLNLIDGFVALGLDLSFSTSTGMCKCPEMSADKSAVNYAIIANYRKVIEWVKAGQLCENKNKIQVYGEAFAALLPKLEF